MVTGNPLVTEAWPEITRDCATAATARKGTASTVDFQRRRTIQSTMHLPYIWKRAALFIGMFASLSARADLLTFDSLPSTTFAETPSGSIFPTVEAPPLVTPPGLVVFPDTVFVTGAPGIPTPYSIGMNFFIPAGFQIVGASVSIKTNGPTEVDIDGHPIQLITDSTIRDILPFIGSGANLFLSPALGDGSGEVVDEQILVWLVKEPTWGPPVTSTAEPKTAALAGAGILGMGFLLSRRKRRS